ncbi:MAG TPA: ketoacyl-ACP synthase III [Gaiella sp.]|nr:ketoacyl-ACP synthase III [Gaiella sp.]
MTVVAAIAHALPEQVVTNGDLERDHPSWDMERVFARSGIRSRRVAAFGETALDLSLVACESLIRETGLDPGTLDAILYCTQTADYPMPGNAHVVHGRLGLPNSVLAFDYNLGCSGYVYGLAIADALVAGGLAREILLVTSATYTKTLNPLDRSTRALLGDGAAVTYVSASATDGGRVVAAELCSSGEALELAWIPGGGARLPDGEEARREQADASGNVRSALDMHMDGPGVWRLANSVLPGHVRDFLATRSLTVDDIDLFVFHQASKMVLDSMARALRIPREKVYTRLEDVGNLSAASIPYALSGAIEEGAIRPGDRVLLCAMGAGLSYGSVLLQY